MLDVARGPAEETVTAGVETEEDFVLVVVEVEFVVEVDPAIEVVAAQHFVAQVMVRVLVKIEVLVLEG